MGWPRTDEAIVMGLIDRINGVPADACQFRFDLSFGAPPACRAQMMERGVATLSPDLLQFSSDRFLSCPGSVLRDAIAEMNRLLDALDLPVGARERVLAGTADAWLRPLPGRR